VEIRAKAAVARVLIGDERVRGVALASGEDSERVATSATVDPKRTFQN
jgi:hypothetical protein